MKFEASDVPVNPLEELCNALILVFQGVEAQIGWHLEPVWYHFRFTFNDDLIALCITEQQGYAARHIKIAYLMGSAELVVLPFYRALKSFIPPDGKENWPAVELEKLKQLTALVKKWKAGRQESTA